MRERNWAGNVTFSAATYEQPTSVEALQQIVAGSPKVRALGSRHSFSTVADTTGVLVPVAELPETIDIDSAASTVRVGGGVRFGALAERLHAAGLALHNMGSLPHISVAGACATGTHGSGAGKGNLASAVVAVEYVDAGGALRTVAKGEDDFEGSVVSLGLLGVVTAVTLSVQPTFDVAQFVYDRMPFESMTGSFEEVMGSAYSVSAFTDWRADDFHTVWLKRRVEDGVPAQEWLGAKLADGPRHPIEGIPAEHCTEQGGVPGPWHHRIPHFRMEFTPSNGDELQTEYLLDVARAPEALEALRSIKRILGPVTQTSEIRTVAADDLWLSESYQRDSVALHFTWVPDAAAVAPAVAETERVLEPLEARPHWGKVFTVPRERVRSLYPRVGDFEALVRRTDPEGKFRNAFVEKYLDL